MIGEIGYNRIFIWLRKNVVINLKVVFNINKLFIIDRLVNLYFGECGFIGYRFSFIFILCKGRGMIIKSY